MQYHAHIYFDHNSPAQYKLTEQVVESIRENFNFPIGRIHKRPVGPHPLGSCQIIFKQSDYEKFVPWLDQNRQGLDILIHSVTGDEYLDHTDNASWLGGDHKLILSIFCNDSSQ